jgi:hypothetical protein
MGGFFISILTTHKINMEGFMKKILVAVLVCVASTFAAWDYFPVIGEGKGEAKIAYYEGRRGYRNTSWGPEFKIRYSPMANLELLSKLGYTLGARYQIMPIVSAGLDIGLPIPYQVWSFTPNVQLSMPLTNTLELGSNAEFTIPGEDPRNERTDFMSFKIGAEVDFTMGQSVAWARFDLSSCFGENSDKVKVSDTPDRGLKISTAIGYIANVGNLALGTSIGMDFGEKSGNDPHNTFIGVDAAIKF